MPGQWGRKTDRGVPVCTPKSASDEVMQEKALGTASQKVLHVTLGSVCKKLQNLREQGSRQLLHVGCHSSRKVFRVQQEDMLTAYYSRRGWKKCCLE